MTENKERKLMFPVKLSKVHTQEDTVTPFCDEFGSVWVLSRYFGFLPHGFHQRHVVSGVKLTCDQLKW